MLPSRGRLAIQRIGGPPPGTKLARPSRCDGRSPAAIGRQTGGRVGFFLHTDDFERDRAASIAAGVRFLEEPRKEAYGTVAVFEDIFGNRWDLLEPAG